MVRRIAPEQIRILWLASLGGALEFYDFIIFVFFTSVIGKLFFAASTADWLRTLQTFVIFAVGYFVRPLGGIVMAHYGDRHGRKKVFTFSIFLMAVPTLLIGFVPTYVSVGAAAPVLLLVLRVLQGVAIGGEAPGGWVFVAEHAPEGRSGLAIGLLTAGLSFGILLGSLVATVISVAFTPSQIAGGIWRLPFVLGGIFGFGALFLRRRLSETPVFEAIRARASASKEVPLGVVIRQHTGAVVGSIVITWTLTAAIVVVILTSPVLLQKLFHTPAGPTQLANLAGTTALCFSTALLGAASDRFGLRRIALPSYALLAASACALYLGAAHGSMALIALYTLAGTGAGAVVFTPIVMVRAFPPLIRYSGVSFSYNVAYAVFGGVTPPLVAWLAHLNPMGPPIYVASSAVAGLFAVLMTPVADSSLQGSSPQDVFEPQTAIDY